MRQFLAAAALSLLALPAAAASPWVEWDNVSPSGLKSVGIYQIEDSTGFRMNYYCMFSPEPELADTKALIIVLTTTATYTPPKDPDETIPAAFLVDGVSYADLPFTGMEHLGYAAINSWHWTYETSGSLLRWSTR